MKKSAPNNLPNPDILVGVWIGISDRTIQVLYIQPDNTFNGTYFTPGSAVCTTLSGKWTLENDLLTFDTAASNPPFGMFPLVDRNRAEMISPDCIMLHTLPRGISLPLNRVQFAAPQALYGQPVQAKPVNPPDVKTLMRMKQNDLNNSNPLLEWIFYLIDNSPKQLHEDKMVYALKNTIPEKAEYYYAVIVFERLWGNGMTSVLLREETAQYQYFLKVVADGYDYYQSPEVADFIRMLAKKAVTWMKKIKALSKREAPEDAFAPIIAEVEGYDSVFDQLLQNKSCVEKALLKDIRTNPEDYVLKKPKTGKARRRS